VSINTNTAISHELAAAIMKLCFNFHIGVVGSSGSRFSSFYNTELMDGGRGLIDLAHLPMNETLIPRAEEYLPQKHY